ncbi:MAG: hypothetical protein QOJ29_3904, partial [Thermoleophilaceae bacterium]|nr:hypothetical protein [Thermoleophilaceae bacterium]
SYILDLIAKTPIGEIHLFDRDVLLQHNAFRSPGAPSIEDLRDKPTKVEYFQQRYAKMRRSIVAHVEYVDETNIESLREMDFVFLCLDDGPARRLVAEHLEQWDATFIDVGMGVWETDGALGGQVRVTTSTPEKRDHVWERSRIPFGPPDPENQYRQNIQIAELNMLNAALAVIRWKKLTGFYLDLEREHFSVYEIDGNDILNEDQL